MTTQPERLTAADFDPAVLRLFDAYVHAQIDRRGFLDRAARYAAGGAGAAALLAALSPDFARAERVARDDPRIKAESVEIDSPAGYGKLRATVVRPARAARALPAVLVVHENRGLNPHIEDIARRLALDDFVAVAPDALSPLGGYPGTRTRRATSSPASTRPGPARTSSRPRATRAAWPVATAGSVPWASATAAASSTGWQRGLPELVAGVAFYGNAPALDEVGRIKAELLLIFADSDERINAAWPAYDAALKAAGVRFEALKYAGTRHGFNNDTTPRFDDNAARQAWGRTIAFFNRTLRG